MSQPNPDRDPALIEATARQIAEGMGDNPDDVVFMHDTLPKTRSGRVILSTATAHSAPAWTCYIPAAERVLRYLLVERIVLVKTDMIDPAVKAKVLDDGMKDETVSWSSIGDPSSFDVVEEFHRCDAQIRPAVQFFCNVCKKMIPAAPVSELDGAYRIGDLTWRLRCHNREYQHSVKRDHLDGIKPGGRMTVAAFNGQKTVPVQQSASPAVMTEDDVTNPVHDALWYMVDQAVSEDPGVDAHVMMDACEILSRVGYLDGSHLSIGDPRHFWREDDCWKPDHEAVWAVVQFAASVNGIGSDFVCKAWEKLYPGQEMPRVGL